MPVLIVSIAMKMYLLPVDWCVADGDDEVQSCGGSWMYDNR